MENWAMIDAFYSFGKASEALYSLAMISSGIPNDLAYVPAYVVNSSFCIEIGLKYLLEKQNISTRGHNLETLYNQLDQTTKEKIENVLSSTQKDITTFSQWFSECLNEASNAFVEWRYFFEPSQNTSTVPNVVNTVNANLTFLNRFREALYTIIPSP